MDKSDALWSSARARALLAAGDVGGTIRLARQSRGWRQQDLADKTGHSRSTISRLETGDRAVTDLEMIRVVAGRAGVPPAFLGAVLRIPGAAAVTVAPTTTPEEDPVRRRQLLALGGTVLAGQAIARPAGSGLMAALADGGTRDMRPWSSARLAAAYQDAAAAFAACRYHDAAEGLTAVTAAARVSSSASAGNAQDFADAILIRSYALISGLGVKAGDDQAARLSADRAFTLASALGDPALLGIAARQSAITLRRAGQQATGLKLLEATARKLDACDPGTSPALLAALGSLHTAAAFNHAQTGHTQAALDAIGHARDLATRADHGKPGPVTPFSLTTVAEYEISVRNALGDPAGALRAARLIQPGTLPTRERSARYGLDVARAWHQQGRDDHALQALIQAERDGPEDVRRPSVRALITTIATAPRPPAGASEFAARTGSLL
jgi:transcriptional regulator with XRE-family HTH domain